MPHVSICMSKPTNEATKNALQLEIGKIMELIPGKNVSNTIFCISDCCSMYKNTTAYEGAFVDIRLYKDSPAESKKVFAIKLFEVIESVVGIPPADVHINFVELPDWAAGGNYF